MADTIATHTLHISVIHVDFSKSPKDIQSAVARIGTSQVPIESRAGKTLRQTFVPPLKLSLQDSFSLQLPYKKMFRMAKEPYNIQFNNEEIFRTGAQGGPEKQEYRMSHKGISIILELSKNSSTDETSDSDLPPTTQEIFQICPRFRILVIGKTGVGKSSLIEHAFGVRDKLTSNLTRGEANIDTEFDSSQNERFVLHDSKGFEAGDIGNVNIVREFIERRKNMPLKDQLHAIWLCFEIPYAGGRFLETGTEDFLALKRDGKLGNVPIVVVFTKYDMLINQANLDLGSSLDGLSDDASKGRIKEEAETKLQEICVKPLEKLAGLDIPHAPVSTEEDYKETLIHLVKITERQVYTADASVMALIAQRVDHSLKIKASIEVGKRKYWTALASSVAFKDRKLWACMHVLHTDIVAVWNFDDPHGYLRSDEFRNLMMNMVHQLNVGPPTNPTKIIAAGLPMVAAIAGILSALSGPAAPIVVPIAAGAVLAAWVYEVYQSSHAVLQRFMSFIVDLTMVLQLLHLASGNRELSRRAIKLAVKLYLELSTSGEVHTKVQEYVGQLTILNRADCDILDKIIELINSYSIDAGDSDIRERIQKISVGPDEMW